MTKPVQIPRYSVQRDDNGSYLRLDQEGSLVGYPDHVADKAAALLQVRSLLEAKAKEWSAAGREWEAECDRRWYICDEHAAELLALAATLGNQDLTNDAGDGA